MIKHMTIASVMAFGAAVSPATALAYDGTVSITGSLSGATCDIKVNNGSKDGTVQLPSVSAGMLSSKGTVAGTTAFSVALSNCANAGTGVRMFFEAGPNVNGADGTLFNRAPNNAAANVAVQLLDMDRQPLKAGDVSQRNGRAAAIENNAAKMTYYAQYYAQDKAEAGAVSTSVTYSIDYL